MTLTRRNLVGAGLGVAGALAASRAAFGAAPDARVALRLLETSDLHMFADDYDYYRGQQDNTVGLTKVATLITQARAEVRNSLLFDNGDILQGNPLGDYVALKENRPKSVVHPMFRAMNLLGYDAATLGNHEFNYGLPFLDAALSGAQFPFVCANLQHVDGRDYLRPYLVLRREVIGEDGRRHTLRIGVIGFVTPQIMTWDHAHLAGRVKAIDIVDAAHRYVPELRAQCDLVVALSHSGISDAPRQGGDENASLYLAQVPGIDVIFTGHAHKLFPGPDYAQIAGADAVRGTLGGIPATMPGFWGSHLGVIDLALEQRNGAWSVADFTVAPRAIYKRDGRQAISLAADDHRILDAVAVEHADTLRWMQEPVGRTAVPITSYFAFVGTDVSLSVVNAAQHDYAAPLLAQTPYGKLPLLSAAAPFKAGGGGPDAFVDLPPGPLDMKDIANLYMFANTVCAVKCTGAELQGWLERSAAIFRQIDPNNPTPQALLDPRGQTFNFDVLSGITYRIDLSRPARFDADGKLKDAKASRIVDLRYQGQPVSPMQEFVVVTNNYRAAGGGGFPGTGASHIVWQAPDYNRDVVTNYIRARKTLNPTLVPVWSFAAMPKPVVVTFDAVEATGRYLGTHPDIGHVAQDGVPSGYVRYGLTLTA